MRIGQTHKEFLWICAKMEITQKRIGSFHMIFLRFFFFFFLTCKRDVTPRAFRNDASNSKVSGTISDGFQPYATKGSDVWAEALQGRQLKVFEQSSKLRFEVFTIRFLICHVSRIKIKTRENGRILDWRGACPIFDCFCLLCYGLVGHLGPPIL